MVFVIYYKNGARGVNKEFVCWVKALGGLQAKKGEIGGVWNSCVT